MVLPNWEGKSKYCLRWRLLKTGGESNASRSTVLRTFIRGMMGLLDSGSKPPILPGRAQACRAFYGRSRSKELSVDKTKSEPDSGLTPAKQDYSGGLNGPAR